MRRFAKLLCPLMIAVLVRQDGQNRGNVGGKRPIAEHVDGVLCRWGYLLMANPSAAFTETRRQPLSVAHWRHPGGAGPNGPS